VRHRKTSLRTTRKKQPPVERDRSMRAYLLNPRQLRINPRERTNG
jgi:hypothetical protein